MEQIRRVLRQTHAEGDEQGHKLFGLGSMEGGSLQVPRCMEVCALSMEVFPFGVEVFPLVTEAFPKAMEVQSRSQTQAKSCLFIVSLKTTSMGHGSCSIEHGSHSFFVQDDAEMS